MTEKRFKEVYPNIIRSSFCFTDNGRGIADNEVVDLLNALHEENEQLKQEISSWIKYVHQLEAELKKKK